MALEHDNTAGCSGFTLIELLVTMTIIGILAGLSVKAYTNYKENAQHSIALTTFNQVRTALEGGKIDAEDFPEAPMAVTFRGPGAPTVGFGPMLLPGILVSAEVQVTVRHDPTCASTACLEDVIMVRHCRTDRMITYSHFYQGPTALNQNAVAPGAC